MLDIKDLKAILVLFRGKKYSYVRGRILVFKDEDTCYTVVDIGIEDALGYTERILRPVSELIEEIEDKYEYDARISQFQILNDEEADLIAEGYERRKSQREEINLGIEELLGEDYKYNIMKKEVE